MSSLLKFSTIEVTRQVFYRNTLSYAIVNLKPIVPGHVLVVPTRPVPRLGDLTPPELSSLMLSVQQVGKVVERVYGADGLTIACQDGKAAGQSVPHVHFHLLPRKLRGDRFAKNDDIYPALERSEGSLHRDIEYARARAVYTERAHTRQGAHYEPLRVDDDDDRKPRTTGDMEKEAQWLRTFFDAESTTSKR